MTDCWNDDPIERPTFTYISTLLLEMMSEMERNRLDELSNVYTNLFEIDETTDNLPRIGDLNKPSDACELPETMGSRPILLENLNGS